MAHFSNEGEPKPAAQPLSVDQFERLVELLTPINLLARFYLDKINNVRPEADPPPEPEYPPHDE